MTPGIGLAIVPIVGLWITFCARREILMAWQSRKWPVVTGQICDKVVREGTKVSLGTDGTMAPRDEHWRAIEPVYTYVVSGKDHWSSRFDFSNAGWSANSRYYELGESVKVYYCPADPSKAVLHPGLKGYLFAGPFVTILGVAGLIWALTQ